MNFIKKGVSHDIGKIARGIPNLERYSMVFANKPYTAEDCKCEYCLHSSRGACCLDQCSYVEERVQAGAIYITEILKVMKASYTDIRFRRRLAKYIRECENEPIKYKNLRHKIVFSEVRKRLNQNDKKYMAALYLLTADSEFWNKAAQYIIHTGIEFQKIRLNYIDQDAYTLFCAAKDIYLGTKHLTTSDLADTELVSPKIFALLCNALAIRKYGIKVLDCMERPTKSEA